MNDDAYCIDCGKQLKTNETTTCEECDVWWEEQYDDYYGIDDDYGEY